MKSIAVIISCVTSICILCADIMNGQYTVKTVAFLIYVGSESFKLQLNYSVCEQFQ